MRQHEHTPEHVASLIEQELAALRSDITNLRHDLGDLVRSVVDVGRDRLGHSAERVQERVQQGLEQFQHSVESLRRQGRQAASGMQQTVKDHPTAAIAAVLIAGLAIGILLRRR
jgi:ElaB/YqjD/DUF883 family membrane-anchored ribosome-binding protein